MKKKILSNMTSTLLLEAVSIICAFILPRMILANFGSEYNGIVSSVSYFLSFVTLLRGGVGGVTRAALYKPLVEGNIEKISGILKATQVFMRKIALIYILFLIVFAALYPLLIQGAFPWLFTFSLVIILGISTFSQYYFGMANQMLLQADQCQYVYDLLQTIATILNTILCVLLINAGFEFRIVKLGSACVFGLSPVVIHLFVRKRYKIITSVAADNTALEQRWSAFAHQLAAFVHTNTDIVLLTIFRTLYDVSVYSVYNMVTVGVKKVVNIFSSSIEAVMGNLMAKDNQNMLYTSMNIYEWVINVVATTLFSCTAMLIIPFVMVYTKGVSDTDYNNPLLGLLMCICLLSECIRLPYQNVVDASGQFRETKVIALCETAINICLSIPLVIWFGCTGVVAGTLAAVVFRTILYVRYVSQKIIFRPVACFIKRVIITVVAFVLALNLPYVIGMEKSLLYVDTYLEWFYSALFLAPIVACTIIFINVVAYPRLTKDIMDILVPMYKKEL